MTNRIPLIVNSSTAQLQELPSGDALDLANSSIVNANAIAANSLAISGNTTVTGNISSGNVLATGYFLLTETHSPAAVEEVPVGVLR